MSSRIPMFQAIQIAVVHALSYAVATVVSLALVIAIITVMTGDLGALAQPRTIAFFALLGAMLAILCAPADFVLRRIFRNSRASHVIALSLSLGGFAAIIFATMSESLQTWSLSTACFIVGGLAGGLVRATLIGTPRPAG